jgi:hypothetical protein
VSKKISENQSEDCDIESKERRKIKENREKICFGGQLTYSRHL